MLQQFHTGMCAHAVMDFSQSSCFPVDVGVKQGCVLGPIIFNLFLFAIALVSHRDLQPSDCVEVEYRLDCGLFNLRRHQAKSKTSSALNTALQYADGAVFPCLTANGLQRSIEVMSESYIHAGLIVNTMKTDVHNASSLDVPTFYISGSKLNNSEDVICFGSNLSFFGDVTNTIKRRINLAS